jgi:Ner family transcriptional regulator
VSDASEDWPRNKIRAAILEKGKSQAALAREAGYSESCVRNAILRPLPSGERIVSDFLGVPVQQIWPSRYFPDGRPRTQPRLPRDPSAPSFPPHRQNRGMV